MCRMFTDSVPFDSFKNEINAKDEPFDHKHENAENCTRMHMPAHEDYHKNTESKLVDTAPSSFIHNTTLRNQTVHLRTDMTVFVFLTTKFFNS